MTAVYHSPGVEVKTYSGGRKTPYSCLCLLQVPDGHHSLLSYYPRAGCNYSTDLPASVCIFILVFPLHIKLSLSHSPLSNPCQSPGLVALLTSPTQHSQYRVILKPPPFKPVPSTTLSFLTPGNKIYFLVVFLLTDWHIPLADTQQVLNKYGR